SLTDTATIALFFTSMGLSRTQTCTLSLHDALPIYDLAVVELMQRLALQRALRIDSWHRTLERVAHRAPAVSGGNGQGATRSSVRSEEHTSELQSRFDLVCRLLLEKKQTSVICIS